MVAAAASASATHWDPLLISPLIGWNTDSDIVGRLLNMEAAEVKVEEIEEGEGGRLVERNLTMISSMLGHTRLPGQQDDELLDVMLVGTVGDVEQDGGSHSGADLLTGVFFSLLAFRWACQDALIFAPHITTLTLRIKIHNLSFINLE